MLKKNFSAHFKRNQDSVISDSSNSQYSNINLNQNFTTASSEHSKSISKKKVLNSDFAFHNNSQTKKDSYSWNKTTKDLSLNSVNHNAEKENKRRSNKCRNSNTFSLQTSTNDNSTQPFSAIFDGKNECLNQGGSIKKLKNAKQIFIDPRKKIENPFQFPRQKETVKTKMPEVAEYKASQRLLYPNQINQQMHTESSEASDGEFSDFSSPLEISLPTSTNQNSNRKFFGIRRNRIRRPLIFGIPPVIPVEFVDFSKLDGYHPQAFVKPSHAVEEIMKVIKELRETKTKDLKNLDNHIKKYYNENVQTPAVFEAKKKALEMIKRWLPKYDPEQKFFICGSTMTKLGSNDSDMDICWVIPVFTNGTSSKSTFPTSEIDGFNPSRILKSAKTLIENSISSTKFPFINFCPARVPILKFTVIVDEQKVRVDLNINNIAGIYNTFMLKHHAKIDTRFPMLAMAIKAWGVEAEIINPTNGYLNTYTIYMMILHFLQSGVSPPVLPNLLALQYEIFNGTIDLAKLEKIYDLDDVGIKMDEKNSWNVGELLIGFLHYFAFFNFKNDGIFVRLACVDSKKTNVEFLIEEVYDRITTAKNLTKRKLFFIKTTLLDAYLGQYDGPNFDKFIHADRTFLEMAG